MDWPLARILLGGYLFSIAIETPVLLAALSPAHPWRRRLLAGVWLTACTYPLFVLALPLWINPYDSRPQYLLVGETLVAIAECSLFWLAFDRGRGYRRAWVLRDLAAVVAANLASFGAGEIYYTLFP